MSVCTYGADELANVAALIFNGNRYIDDRFFVHVVDALATVSKANAACFNYRYAVTIAQQNERTPKVLHEAAPVSAREILQALKRARLTPMADIYRCDFERAATTASMLHYNCDDDGGDQIQKIEGASAALIVILEGVNTALLVKMGVRS